MQQNASQFNHRLQENLPRILLVIVTLILSMALLGCIPLVFVAGATAGGAIVYDKRDTNAMLTDNTIAKKAKYQIDHDPILKNDCRIKVSVFNRVLLLVGQVPDESVRQRAYQDMMNIRDVKRVYNQIEISSPLSLMQQSDDTLLTSTLKSLMLATIDLHSTQIKVVTENKVVYLMGIVTRKQAALAAKTASHVKGITKVIEIFEYEE